MIIFDTKADVHLVEGVDFLPQNLCHQCFCRMVIHSEYKREDFLKWRANYGFCVHLSFWYNTILYGRTFENIYVIVLIKSANQKKLKLCSLINKKEEEKILNGFVNYSQDVKTETSKND